MTAETLADLSHLPPAVSKTASQHFVMSRATMLTNNATKVEASLFLYSFLGKIQAFLFPFHVNVDNTLEGSSLFNQK